jgi:hypothetical protein
MRFAAVVALALFLAVPAAAQTWYSAQPNGSVAPNSLSNPPLSTGSSTGNVLVGPAEMFVCTAACTVTPPVPVAGYEFCVWNDAATNGVITLGALGSSARYQQPEPSGTSGGYGTAGTGTLTSAGAYGDLVCIVGRDSTHYLTTSYVGTWTAS